MPVKVFGLPTHILLIHVAVVGIPLACLAVIAVAARPSWRRKFGVWAALLAVLVTALTYITQLAGLSLFNHAPYLQKIAQQHKNLGQTLVYFVGAMAVLMIILVIADRAGYADHHAVMVTITALTIAAGAICLVRVVQVGDSGARAVWGGINLSDGPSADSAG
jgi:uncharacterized membrane protein HdeD (DUF308 family)